MLLRRLVVDERGQDLIEYGLLTGIITAGLIAIMPTLLTHIGAAFTAWGTGTNNLWVPGEPAP